MSMQAVRKRYVQDAVSTVTPARLVTMLYDALVRDLELARQALTARDIQVAHDRLIHAQEVVLELQSGLDVTKWDAAPALASLYSFLHRELVTANVRKDVTKVIAVRDTVEPLRLAWHEAALATGSAA